MCAVWCVKLTSVKSSKNMLALRKVAALPGRRSLSDAAPRRMLLDTLAFSRRLVDAGVSDREAFAIASELAQALQNADLIYASELASKSELTRTYDQHLAGLDQCKSEMRGGQDTQRVNLDKMKTEMRYEIDKLTASQKLDVNLERGRIRDELQKQNDRIMGIDSRIDREVNLIRTHIEASKNDLLRYSVATLASLGAVTLAAVRLML